MSIVQRIRLGFTLLLVLLLLLGAISYLKTTSIHGRFQQVTEEATPQALTASRLRAALLMADRDSLAHLAIRETSAFPESRQRVAHDKVRYEQHIKAFAALTLDTESERQLARVTDQAPRLFTLSEQLMSLHEESVELERVLSRMRSELLHLDDNYRSAADLLVRYTAGRRSLQNKAELITSGIARDLKLILRADGNTDLVALQGVLAKDIDIANQRLERIVVPDDVKARFTRHVARIPQLVFGDKGLIATLVRRQQISQQLHGLREQQEAQSQQLGEVLDRLIAISNQSMQEDRLSADVAVDSARTWIVMVALCSVLIALIVAWSTARSIQVPLVRINRVLGLMAQGDMTLRVRYPARNELGEVANSIDQLAHHTKTLLMEVQTGSEYLVSETRKTAEIGEQVMSQVQAQKAQTDQVAAAIFELETSATEVARSSDHVRREVGEANDESRRGRHLMQANRDGWWPRRCGRWLPVHKGRPRRSR